MIEPFRFTWTMSYEISMEDVTEQGLNMRPPDLPIFVAVPGILVAKPGIELASPLIGLIELVVSPPKSRIKFYY